MQPKTIPLASKRTSTWMALLLIVALLLQACAPAAPGGVESAAPEAAPAGPVVNALGKELPPDAAPLDQQVLIYPYSGWRTFTTIDFFQAVYERADALTDLLSDSLVRLDKNFQVNPGAATEWSVDESGLVWTFKLDPNLMWNDGTPVTADDYVATFRYGADPTHAWDFSWYYQGVIKNWTQAVNGEVPVEEIGVRAVDAHTLEFTTEMPAPYLPAMLLYSAPLQKKALETHGGLYNSNPATSVSSGPYKLVEWTKDQRLVYEINPDYKGTNIPYIQRLVVVAIGQPSQLLPAYEANEIDFVWGSGTLSPADLELIENDPELSAQYHPHYGDFRTYYFAFDVSKPPFDNLLVRQAFAHVLDRDTILPNIVKRQGIPAYSFLMPGFPASNSEAFKDTYPYDVEKAKQLLAEAGYPNGEGFPKLVMKLRAEGPTPVAVAQAYAAALKEHLGVEVEVSNMDFKSYMDELNAKPTQVQFTLISYGMDYLDPSNMLGVFLSGGRHPWSNAEYDRLVKEASSFTGDPAERTRMFQEAEKILVEDAAFVFVYHQTPGDLIKPFIKGPALEPDNNGVAAWHWPGFSTFSDLLSGVYITKDVANYRQPPQ
ncbi:peptide ABC transporter substrate-binding protein [Caldilinea sp.]|uniref:peptide ABC transporter substrate-binding protein n=1 Tax=Caldilinea sp. TaxID=2293560 RepID=UPI0021DDEA8C|nr:peptide ABC transporter substrate-binding protein [Caldilinea sp.]GIV69132.1 MAG: ABC transporter substrate-binding protein [Caldilinea sp.]